jgi:hypothetical protein
MSNNTFADYEVEADWKLDGSYPNGQVVQKTLCFSKPETTHEILTGLFIVRHNLSHIA